jgi:hypothetical protein
MLNRLPRQIVGKGFALAPRRATRGRWGVGRLGGRRQGLRRQKQGQVELPFGPPGFGAPPEMHLTVLGHQQFEAHHLGLELTDLMAQGGHLVRRVDGGGVTGWGMTRVTRDTRR